MNLDDHAVQDNSKAQAQVGEELLATMPITEAIGKFDGADVAKLLVCSLARAHGLPPEVSFAELCEKLGIDMATGLTLFGAQLITTFEATQ